MSASSKPTPIALPNALSARIDAVAERMGLKKQEVMRLAMEVGLEDLKRIDYNLAGAVVDKAKGHIQETPTQDTNDNIVPLAMLAEPVPTYKAKRKAE